MKTCILAFIFLCLTNHLVNAQNEIAALTTFNQPVHTTHKRILNLDYLNSVTNQDLAKKIQKIQKIVAKYNIKTSDVFQSKRHGSYTVDFKEGDNHVTAVYDKNGELTSCQEHYKAIKLPYALSSALTKDYPNWGIKEVHCEIQYVKNTEPTVVYQVAINKKNKSKKITLKL